jgi:hypothetical protein
MANPNADTFLNSINPDNSIKATVLVDVPVGKQPDTVELHDSPRLHGHLGLRQRSKAQMDQAARNDETCEGAMECWASAHSRGLLRRVGTRSEHPRAARPVDIPGHVQQTSQGSPSVG